MQQPDTGARPGAIDLALYDRYAPAVLAYLCRHLSNAQDAEDLLVEAFLAALSKPGFSDLAPKHQQAWLHRVAHNKMVDRLRKTTRMTLVSLDEALERESPDLTPEQHSLRQENYARLYQSIASLAPEQQQLIQLRYGEGLRLTEIAARLCRPAGTVRKQLLRTLRHLRELYDQPRRERED